LVSFLVPFFACALLGCQLLAGLDKPLDAPPANDGGTSDGAADAASGDARGDATPGTSSRYAAVVLSDKPVAYYTFDEPEGARCADRSGRAADANLTGTFERGRPSALGDPGGRSVRLGGGAGLPLDPRFDFDFAQDSTFELWIRPSDPTPEGAMMTNLTSVDEVLSGSTLYFAAATPYVGYERWSTTLVRYAHVTQPLAPTPSGVFHFVVVNSGATATLFVNGTRYDGSPGSSTEPFRPRSLVVGQLPGDYDELAIYDRALSDVRIAEHYAVGIAK